MAFQKYSLWLMPTGTIYRKFSEIISHLAEEHSSPKFQPHVTLIGNIAALEEEIIIKSQEVADLIHPYIIRLANVDYTDHFYKALFVRVEPSVEGLAAYQEAKKVFPRNQDTNYMPHLGLLYGDFAVETKKQIIKKIGDRFNDEFEAATLYLYLTNSVWRKIKEFPLRM